MIRYLKQEEKAGTRVLYEASFPEDTEQFIDYYYDWKIRNNKILVMEEQGRIHGVEEADQLQAVKEPAQLQAVKEPVQLQVMIHLNPYTFQICGELAEINYIVAVATDAGVRKQGRMAQVLKQALQDMAKEHQPFTFLIPANPKVYVSSGFVFVPSEKLEEYDRKLHQIQQEPERAFLLREATHEDIPAMAAFANDLLEQEYHVFPYRTRDYYERIMAELECQNGGLLLMEQEGCLTGIVSYGSEDNQAELQEILAEPAVKDSFISSLLEYFGGRQVAITEMNYMVRILDLRVLGLLLCSEESFSMKVQVEDEIISSNCGSFEIKVDETGSSITAISPEEAQGTMNITELTEFLFGKMKLFIREWV